MESFSWILSGCIVYVIIGLFIFILGMSEEGSLDDGTFGEFVRALLFCVFVANLYIVYLTFAHIVTSIRDRRKLLKIN